MSSYLLMNINNCTSYFNTAPHRTILLNLIFQHHTSTPVFGIPENTMNLKLLDYLLLTAMTPDTLFMITLYLSQIYMLLFHINLK